MSGNGCRRNRYQRLTRTRISPRNKNARVDDVVLTRPENDSPSLYREITSSLAGVTPLRRASRKTMLSLRRDRRRVKSKSRLRPATTSVVESLYIFLFFRREPSSLPKLFSTLVSHRSDRCWIDGWINLVVMEIVMKNAETTTAERPTSLH